MDNSQSTLDAFVDGRETPDAGTYSTELPTDPTVADSITLSGMDAQVLAGQRVQGKVDIRHGALAICKSGSDTYLSERETRTVSIAPSYASWTDDFATEHVGVTNTPVVQGPTGIHTSGDEWMRIHFQSSAVRAGVRLLTGGGRFSKDRFTFHVATPFGILDHDNGKVIIAPFIERLSSTPDGESIEFTYRNSDTGVPEGVRMTESSTHD